MFSLGRLVQAKQLRKLGRIEADHGLAVNDGYRRAHIAELFQLRQCLRVLRDILLFKGNLVLRKKLFRLAAEESPGLAVDDYTLGHLQASCPFRVKL